MPSLIPVAVYIFQILSGITASIYSYFFRRSGFPPQVPSLLAGYDNGLSYALNPCGFLSKCQQKYGPIYRVSLGPWRLIVISSGDAISSVLSVCPQLLGVDTLHRKMFRVVAGDETNYSNLHQLMIFKIYPLINKTLSLESLGQTSQSFGLVLLSQIKDFILNHTGPGSISLTELANKPLFTATNLVLFGSAFSTDTYRDFQTLNKSIPYRFCGTLRWHWPSYAARMRLLKSIGDYLRQEEAINHISPFSLGFSNIFKDNKIQPLDGAKLTLTFMWVVHSNMLNNAFFLLSFLLGNPDGFARVRAEIDSAVEKFGGLEELLQACPSELDDPSFRLLTSAIMETMRFTSLHAIRRATCDFELKLNDGVGTIIPMKKGEFVFGNVQAAHMDTTVFANPATFLVDRFAQHSYRKKRLQTQGYPFFSLSGGNHICRGRWLVIYELKVLLIILFRMFDFSPVEESSVGWHLPRVHKRSIGVIHTDDDVLVQLSPREVKDEL